MATIAGSRTNPVPIETVRSRIFTEKQKSEAVLEAFFNGAIKCEITGGIINPAGNLQHDHRIKWADGGKTTRDNQRLTHPFTNNQRDAIEAFQQNTSSIRLPHFEIAIQRDNLPKQLKLIDDKFFDE